MAQVLSSVRLRGMGVDHSTATHCPQPALVACIRFRPYAPSQYFPVLVRSSEWPGSLFFGRLMVLTLTSILYTAKLHAD